MFKLCKNAFAKKVVCFSLLCAIGSQLYSVNSLAATKSWSLCRTNGPSSEWLTKREITFTTTKSTTKVTCDKVGGGARIAVSTSNGIYCAFSRAGSVSVSSAIGKDELAYIRYTDIGTRSSNPSGKIVY